MSNRKLLTISIAAYNVEEYINNTIRSLVDSKKILNDIEIIIVNDGSLDNTVNISKEYARKYSNSIILIDKENKGYGSTINESLKIASGKYFKLLDGDDWYDTSELCKFVDVLKESNADLIFTKYTKINDITKEKVVIKNGDLIYDGITKEFNTINNKTNIAMHEIAFKTSILKNNNIHITENCYYTDVEYVLKPLEYVKTMSSFDINLYMYRQGRIDQSISIKSISNKYNQALQASLMLAEYYENNLKKKNNYNAKFIKSCIVDSVQNKAILLLKFDDWRLKVFEFKKFLEKIKRNCPNIYKDLYNGKSYKKNLIVFIMLITNFKLNSVLKKVLKYLGKI